MATVSLMRTAHPTVLNRLIIGFNAIDALCHVSLTLWSYAVQEKIVGVWAGIARPNTHILPPTA